MAGMARDHFLKQRAVVLVRPREFCRERDTLPLGHNMALRARGLPRSVGFAPVRAPPFFAGTLALSSAARLQSDLILLSQPVEQLVMDAPPHSSLLPFSEPAPAGQPRAAAHLLGKQLPRNPGAQHKENPGEHTCRLGMRLRPPLGRGGSGGKSSSIAAQRSSPSNGFAIRYHATNQPVLSDALKLKPIRARPRLP
jgi:hypothetical protein